MTSTDCGAQWGGDRMIIDLQQDPGTGILLYSEPDLTIKVVQQYVMATSR